MNNKRLVLNILNGYCLVSIYISLYIYIFTYAACNVYLSAAYEPFLLVLLIILSILTIFISLLTIFDFVSDKKTIFKNILLIISLLITLSYFIATIIYMFMALSKFNSHTQTAYLTFTSLFATSAIPALYIVINKLVLFIKNKNIE